MNGLSGDTYVFAEIDEKYGVYMLKELYELHNQGHAIKVPVLLNERGEKTWVEVEDVVSFGLQPLKRITLATSRLFLEISEDAIIPAYSCELFSGTEKQIILKINFVNELNVSQAPRYNDTLLLAMHHPLNIPEGDQKEYDFGFALGFYLSEGNIVKRKHKNTKQSLATINGFARKKGMTVEEYLKHTTDIKQVQLTVGENDFERKYVDILLKHFKLSKPSKKKHTNAYTLCSTDLSFIHLIKNYTDGSDSHTKHLKNEAFNRTKKFLEGIMDGFLCGDGHFRKDADLFHVGITTNYKLRDDLIFISKALGYDVHLWKAKYKRGGFAWSDKFYWSLQLGIFKTYHRRTALGLVREHIKSVEDVGEKEAFNLVLKPLYPENDKRAKFNHLFFTAYGFLVLDAIKNLRT